MFEDWPEEFDPPSRRIVDPPTPVAVDLGQAFPNDAPTFRRDQITMRVKAGGLDLTATVPGLLHAWARTTDGSWLGLVEVVVWTGNGHGQLPMMQLCPQHALAPRGNRPTTD